MMENIVVRGSVVPKVVFAATNANSNPNGNICPMLSTRRQSVLNRFKGRDPFVLLPL